MIYSITYNDKEIDPTVFHNFLTNLPNIIDWWHYLPNMYLVSTTLDEKQLANKTIERFSGRFIVLKVDLDYNNGVLPKTAWDWINKHRTKKIIRFKQPTSKNTIKFPIRNISQSKTISLNDLLKKRE